MLAYILALAVGLGSFSIYMAAFFFPEVHRKSDFTWSGVGLFYALIFLWTEIQTGPGYRKYIEFVLLMAFRLRKQGTKCMENRLKNCGYL